MITALILMGGEGKRLGASLPKQFHLLGRKRIYLHTLEVFLQVPLIREILLITHPDWIQKVTLETSSYTQKLLRVIQGGPTRQLSSFLGLQNVNPDTEFVIIHDAVRPFVTKELLTHTLEMVKIYKAVDTCIPSCDTIVYAPDPKNITSIPVRAHYLRGQTPQSFSYPLLLKAHLHAERLGIEDASDDCQLILNLKEEVRIIAGESRNIKITTPLDLLIADLILKKLS